MFIAIATDLLLVKCTCLLQFREIYLWLLSRAFDLLLCFYQVFACVQMFVVPRSDAIRPLNTMWWPNHSTVCYFKVDHLGIGLPSSGVSLLIHEERLNHVPNDRIDSFLCSFENYVIYLWYTIKRAYLNTRTYIGYNAIVLSCKLCTPLMRNYLLSMAGATASYILRITSTFYRLIQLLHLLVTMSLIYHCGDL